MKKASKAKADKKLVLNASTVRKLQDQLTAEQLRVVAGGAQTISGGTGTTHIEGC
jgi:hypothetical protein